MSNKGECVKVVLRCRPLSKTETANGNTRIVEMDKRTMCVRVTNPSSDNDMPKPFTYDAVYDWTATQSGIYEETVRYLVDSVLEGYNGTIFAYGQTGTGKTFSMEGVLGDDNLQGVMPRAFEHVFTKVAHAGADTQFLVRASFIEIYQDNVLDLLGTDSKAKLKLKEDPEKGVFIAGLSTFVVKTRDETFKLLENGKKNRKTGATLMNADSSRSHCIFSIVIEQSDTGADGEQHIRVGKLNMVDLAGSERQGKTGAEGMRLQEATKINLSLSALGNVISALTSRSKKHVPYRDSKLTRLLQDSLGGNTKTVMIANIGPADYNYEETISTLRFATRAKDIKNKPKINEDPKDAMLREFQDEISRLKAALAADGGFDGGDGGGGGDGSYIGPGGKIIVNKVVEKVMYRGVTKDQLEEIDAAAAAKRAALAEGLDAEEEEIRRRKEELEQKNSNLSAALQSKEEMAQQRQQETMSMADQLKGLEERLLVGAKLVKDADREKELLRTQQAALLAQQQAEERINAAIKAREESQPDLVERYESKEKEVQATVKKLNKLREKYSQVKQDVQDVQAEQQSEREHLLETIRELTRRIELKDLIIDNFVPSFETDKIESRAHWDEEADEYYLSEIDYKTHGKEQRPMSVKPGFTAPISEYARIPLVMGDRNPRFHNENILELELDMPMRTTQNYQDLQYRIEQEQRQQQGDGGFDDDRDQRDDGGHHDVYQMRNDDF